MKRVTFLVSTFVTLFPIFPGPSLAKDLKSVQDIYRDTVDSVAYIITDGGVCAATLISQTRLLTSWHCVYHMRTIEIGWRDSVQGGTTEGVEVIAFEPKSDLALVQIPPQTDRQPITIGPLSESLNEGDQLITIGHSQDASMYSDTYWEAEINYSLLLGRISRVGDRWIVADSQVNPGSSGGPVLDDKGRLIGVTSGVKGKLFRFTSLSAVHQFLSDALLSNSDAKPVSVWNGRHRFVLDHQIFWDRTIARGYGIREARYGLLLQYVIADRISVGYLESLFRPDKIRAVEVGYRFKWGTRMPVSVMPIFGRQFYPGDDQRESLNKVGMELDVPFVPNTRIEFLFHPDGVRPQLAMIF